MQTRGPGQSSKETEPCGQAHPDSIVHTGEARTSLSQSGEQHRSVVGAGRSQADGPMQKRSVGHAADET